MVEHEAGWLIEHQLCHTCSARKEKELQRQSGRNRQFLKAEVAVYKGYQSEQLLSSKHTVEMLNEIYTSARRIQQSIAC